MSSNTYVIKDAVSNKDFISQDLSKQYTKGIVSITFYSDEYKTPVTPTSGKIVFTASEDNFNFGDLDEGEVDVTNKKYKRPYWALGSMQNVKASFSDVTGATHFVIRISVSD